MAESFTRFGAKAWNCFPSQMYKLKIREAFCAVLDIECRVYRFMLNYQTLNISVLLPHLLI